LGRAARDHAAFGSGQCEFAAVRGAAIAGASREAWLRAGGAGKIDDGARGGGAVIEVGGVSWSWIFRAIFT